MRPLPREENTPPVTKIKVVLFTVSRGGAGSDCADKEGGVKCLPLPVRAAAFLPTEGRKRLKAIPGVFGISLRKVLEVNLFILTSISDN